MPGLSDNEAIAREGGLHRTLGKRQITMIGLGGAIGTGLFMGSGIAIGYAGPAVLLSYLIAALIAVIMVFSLSEMAVVHPTAGSFGTYAEIYLGPFAGFLIRYTYWIQQVLLIGSEAIAIGTYMRFWFPEVPIWLSAIGFSGALLWLNSRPVRNFASVEYWLTVIKVTAIVLFIIVGGSRILGLTGPSTGLHNVIGLPGGFMPNGFSGVWMGVLMALFSFLGLEFVVATAGEAENPREAIPAALRTMAARLFLFYILALFIILAFMPWTQAGAKVVTQSPFVRMFGAAGIPYAADAMNFVVAVAALSAMNTSLYLASRMLFSLSRGGYAPALFGKLSAGGVPLAATLLSGACVLLAGSLAMLTPLAYNYLFGVALFGGILTWASILASHMVFRRRHAAGDLPVKMPFFPAAQLLGLGLLAAITATMAFDHEFWDVAVLAGGPWCVFVAIVYRLWAVRRGRVAASATIAN
ncbi:amino acid permease [uncultured Sphingomonas sp.]|uniref:amino acid permease n=1 Tax=uncultured Sphingomonas sp. TaxID=158754 RepID=UPI00262163A8|nr:amino acid permease [uncultured Sphingomonas sp.]